MITSIRELRSSTKEILNAVSRGNTVWLTNHGKTCAKIVPAHDAPKKHSHKDEAFGMWKGRKESVNVHSYVRDLRKWRRAH